MVIYSQAMFKQSMIKRLIHLLKLKQLGLFIKERWTQIAIVCIFLLFIGHLVAFFFLSRYDQKTQLAVNRGIIARQIITLVEAVQINPPDKRPTIVNAIDIPNVDISLDQNPFYEHKVPQLQVWDVVHTVHKMPQDTRLMQLSVKIDDRHWLNISARIARTHLTMQAFLLTFEGLIILGAIIIVCSINRFNRPLKRFVSTVENIDHPLGMNQLPEDDGPQMVRKAAKAVNNMQHRIQQLIQDKTQMLAAISHDLRTPITRLKLRAQFVEDEKQQQKIIQDLEEMETMLNQSLNFFQDQQPLEHTRTDLASLLYAIYTDYKEMNSKISYQGASKNLAINAHALSLKRAFSNLIDNALKYADKAKINLNKRRGYAIITIEDNGPGIPSEDFDKVFSPFYRGDHSRSKHTGGIGLGLAVAYNIIHAHQGQIQLFNSKHQSGLKVRIILPLPEE